MAFPLKIECPQAVAQKFTTLYYEPEKTHWVVFGIDENGQQFIDSLFIGDDNILELLANDIAQSAPRALSSSIESATEIQSQLDPAAVDSLMAKIAEMESRHSRSTDSHFSYGFLALFPDGDPYIVNSSFVNVGDLRVLPALLTQPSGLALKCALAKFDFFSCRRSV